MKAEMVQRFLEQVITEKEPIREIRIRIGKPVFVLDSEGEKILNFDEKSGNPELLRIEDEKENSGIENGSMADSELIRALMEIFARHSLYAYEREISQGFLTIRGGHRIGITGKAVVESGHVKTVRDISSLNIRIAHEIKGCAKSVLPHLLSGEEFLDTLVISPPGAGKTTLLRDLIRELSSGGSWGSGKNVSVVDERSEIAACFGGVPQCDLGPRTDVMDGCPKAVGMLMMLRSMAPQVLAVDEAGGEEEIRAMKYAMKCGCRILATVHGADMEDIMKRPVWKDIVGEKIFSRYVVLTGVPTPGTVAEIYDESVCQCREKSTCEDRYAAAAFSYRSQLRMTGKWENEKI